MYKIVHGFAPGVLTEIFSSAQLSDLTRIRHTKFWQEAKSSFFLERNI